MAELEDMKEAARVFMAQANECLGDAQVSLHGGHVERAWTCLESMILQAKNAQRKLSALLAAVHEQG